MNRAILLLIIFTIVITFAGCNNLDEKKNRILHYTVDISKQNIEFFLKNDNGEKFKTFRALNEWLESRNKSLIFAMNGGMFKTDFSPQGLYIENGALISNIDSIYNGYGNFYLQPNGIFYITNNNEGRITTTKNFINNNIKFATQSGPMLLINGKIHSAFNKGSANINIRNGVGILPNGHIIFAMSTDKINLYDFAHYFLSLGCKDALYLDGVVSKTYLPVKGHNDLSRNFGVIIGETTEINNQ
jgi:uncharacterized protein YigE (DUF2233 family)